MSTISIEQCHGNPCPYAEACLNLEEEFDINGCTIRQYHPTGLPMDAAFDHMYGLWVIYCEELSRNKTSYFLIPQTNLTNF